MRASDLLDKSFMENFKDLPAEEQQKVIAALKEQEQQSTPKPKPVAFTAQKSVVGSFLTQQQNT